MQSGQLLQEIERYRVELIQIMKRFKKSSNGYRMRRDGDPRFRTFVIEIIDLLTDTLGKNQYSPRINQIFKEGVSNDLQIPSYKSVEEIVSVIKSVETRIKRNPEFVKQKELVAMSSKKNIEYPSKITLKWLWEYVPINYWVWFLGLLISAFIAGIAFTEIPLYKNITKYFMIDQPQNNQISVAPKKPQKTTE